MNQDQHARDDCTVRLDLHAVLFRAEQMTATQQLLEHPEEQFDEPAMPVQLRDQFGGNVESAGGNPQYSITLRSGARPPVAATTDVRRRSNADNSDGVIWL